MSVTQFPNLYRVLGIDPLQEIVPVAPAFLQPATDPLAPLLLEMIARGVSSTQTEIHQPLTDEEIKSLFEQLDLNVKNTIDGKVWELDGKQEEWNYGATHRFDKKLTFFNAVLSSLGDKDSLIHSYRTLPKQTQLQIEMHLYILCHLQRYDSNENFGPEGFRCIEQLYEIIKKTK